MGNFCLYRANVGDQYPYHQRAVDCQESCDADEPDRGAEGCRLRLFGIVLCSAVILLLPDLESNDIQLSCGRVVP